MLNSKGMDMPRLNSRIAEKTRPLTRAQRLHSAQHSRTYATSNDKKLNPTSTMITPQRSREQQRRNITCSQNSLLGKSVLTLFYSLLRCYSHLDSLSEHLHNGTLH